MSYVASERIGFLRLNDEQQHDYRRVARVALERYDLRVSDVGLVATHSNVVFSVTDSDGARYALRISPDHSDAVDLASELAFLIAVGGVSGIRVPVPIANNDGQMVTTIKGHDVGHHNECVLFTWLTGTPVGAMVNSMNYTLMGEIAAKLHAFSKNWLPPVGFRPLVWNRLFYYPNVPVLLFDKGQISPLVPQWSHSDIRYLAERAANELAALDAMPEKRTLHGNLEMWNVVVEHGRAGLLDFEEVMSGQPIHDIAIALHYGRSRPDYPRLRDAFRGGYERIAPWPVDSTHSLDLLSAARGMLFLNFALQRTPIPSSFIERECRRLVELRHEAGTS